MLTNDVVTTILIALTTFVIIELLLRPRIERIRAVAQVRNDLRDHVLNLGAFGAHLAVEIPVLPDRALTERMKAEQERARLRINEITLALSDNLGRYAGAYLPPFRDLVVDYVAGMRGVVISRRGDAQRAEIFKNASIELLVALGGPWWWRPIRRARAIVRLRRGLANVFSKAESTA